MEYRGFLQCQKCGKVIGWGFTGYCHNLEMYCLDCYIKVQENES